MICCWLCRIVLLMVCLIVCIICVLRNMMVCVCWMCCLVGIMLRLRSGGVRKY